MRQYVDNTEEPVPLIKRYILDISFWVTAIDGTDLSEESLMSLHLNQLYSGPAAVLDQGPGRIRGNVGDRGRGRAEVRAWPGRVIDETPDAPDGAVSRVKGGETDYDELVWTLMAAFRWHPHVNNVLTHVCGSQWTKVEQALRAIVDPRTTRADLSSLARNIVELMWAERGVTGRILKPYLREVLVRNLTRQAARRLQLRIAGFCVAQEEDVICSGEPPERERDAAATAEVIVR